ncbi:PepSY domain-containing protein [Alphaproteobacteria bacterium]|nr:PepSY domain-containing protein [Alphaproteobacteria bacterium]
MKIHVLKLKLRKLHKYLGFAFSLFIVHLTVTGILLIYPKTFNIEDTYISNFFILKKYNMDTYREVYGLNDIEDEIITIKNNIYLNSKFIDKFKDDITSILYQKKRKEIIILSNSIIGIYFFENIDGELEINNIISLENTKKIKYLGLNLSDDIVFLKNDNEFYNFDDNYLLKLVNIKDKNIKWSNISKTDKKLAKYYLNIHQGKGVSLTRIITELHNGKFFGSIFTLVLFFSSLSLIFLTLSSFIFATNIFKNKKK